MMECMMIHTPPGTEFLHGRRAEMHEDGQGARHSQDAPVASHDSRAVYYRYAFQYYIMIIIITVIIIFIVSTIVIMVVIVIIILGVTMIKIAIHILMICISHHFSSEFMTTKKGDEKWFCWF